MTCVNAHSRSRVPTRTRPHLAAPDKLASRVWRMNPFRQVIWVEWARTQAARVGARNLKLHASSGSGPSDPRLTCTLIGNASTRRLAKVAKLGSDLSHRSNRYRRFLPHAASAAVGFALQTSDAFASKGEHADGHVRPSNHGRTAALCGCSQAGSPLGRRPSRAGGDPWQGMRRGRKRPSDTSFESPGGPTLETFNRCNAQHD
jgi:hypothetical protein